MYSPESISISYHAFIPVLFYKMENESGRPFPHGSVLKKFEGTIYQLGDMQFRPTKIICEELGVSGIARRDAIFDAENVNTGELVVLKLGAEYIRIYTVCMASISDNHHRTDPTVYCDPSSIDMYRSRGLSTFQEKAHMFQEGSSSGYTPDCIAYAEFQQDDRYEYPGGYLCVLVLSKNPIHTRDFRLAVIRHELTGSELQLALRQCEEMFRTFRARGLSLGINAPELEYDPETKKP